MVPVAYFIFKFGKLVSLDRSPAFSLLMKLYEQAHPHYNQNLPLKNRCLSLSLSPGNSHSLLRFGLRLKKISWHLFARLVPKHISHLACKFHKSF